MRQPIRLLAALTMVLLAACTTGGNSVGPAATPQIVESISDSGLAARLLAVEDLPEGYTETELPNLKGGVGALIGCPSIDVRSSSGTGEATVAFAGAVPGNLISETVRLTSAADSRQILADLRAVPQKCSNAKAANIAALGSESTSIKLTASPAGLGGSVDGYLVGVRNDQVLVLVVYVSPGSADPAAVEAVARAAWEKATK